MRKTFQARRCPPRAKRRAGEKRSRGIELRGKIRPFSKICDYLHSSAVKVHSCAILHISNSTLRIEQKPRQSGRTAEIGISHIFMPRILSISYDKALLHTRELMLSREGFEMVSAVGFSAAVEACKKEQFDLVIMGHSIPTQDKTAIIAQLRAICDTPILALRRPNEEPLKSAEYNLDPGDPQSFLAYVKEITNHKPRSAK
jgi:CheY-like chemotaxis protein